nr:fructosamine kinase family protein [Lacticaseibacillus thailandensis]
MWVRATNGGYEYQFCQPLDASWSDLFVGERLDRLAAQLTRKGLWTAADAQQYQRVRSVVVHALQHHQEAPVLLHGDLWSGNFMFTADGQPALIDPAALYGDREFDIGISTVFGGFTAAFYTAYQQVRPLAPGYEQRLPFYQLYLLMVHLDKFGAAYYDAVTSVMHNILTV